MGVQNTDPCWISYNLEVYVEKLSIHLSFQMSEKVGMRVLCLEPPIPKNRTFKLFFDNWFSSVPLMLVLAQQGIHCTGIVRLNRLPGSSMVKDDDLKKIRAWILPGKKLLMLGVLSCMQSNGVTTDQSPS